MTDTTALHTALTALCPRVLTREPMASHTSFRIGGAAALVALPTSREELVAVLNAHRTASPAYPLLVLGNGSNVLFPDEGFEGLVVLTGGVRQVQLSTRAEDEDRVCVSADSGASLTALANTCMKDDCALSGLEFAYGIPGTVGGAVVMNAGAYGGEMADVLTGCDYYDPTDGQVHHLTREEMNLSYRHSIFIDHPHWVVLGAEMALTPGDAAAIRATAESHMAARRDKQPLELPNAGSVFKRPEGHFAGKLIQDCGLKGYTVGGAQVSEKHAGFIVNRGGATAADVKALVAHIQHTVKDTFGVSLECEIRFV